MCATAVSAVLPGMNPLASLRVHRVVVLQILPRLDRAPPLLVLLIPPDRPRDGLLKSMLRPPPQFPLSFFGIDRIPSIVSRPVFHIFHGLIPFLSHQTQDRFRQRSIVNLIIAADIVDLARPAFC